MPPLKAYSRLLPIALVFLSACATGEQLTTRRPQPAQRVTRAPAPTPRAAYTAILEASRDSAIIRTWEEAGAAALRAPIRTDPNVAETLVFPPDLAIAATYRFDMRRGDRVDVEIRKDRGSSDIFADVFEVIDSDMYRHREAADRAATKFSYTATMDGTHVLRVQPPAGGGGRYNIRIKGNGGYATANDPAPLAFPVAGADPSAIRGQWGDSRDGGARSHKGVDIFAPRGTLVKAAADGVISSVDDTPVGGRIVWQRDDERGLLYYYAHLNEQLVREGERVRAGDAIGRVGNTGNASGGSPHLHFGVFESGYVALDPTPMLSVRRVAVAAVSELPVAPPAMLGSRISLPSENVRLRSGPGDGSDVLAQLEAGTSILVLGAIGGWSRVVLGDGRTGFIASRLLER